LRKLLGQGGQYKAIQGLDKFEIERDDKKANIRKNTSAADKSDFETQMGRLAHGAALFGQVKDQPSYEAALQIGSTTGTFAPEFLQKLPPTYNPQIVEALKAAGLKRAEQLTAENQAGVLAQTTSANAVRAANEPFSVGPNGAVTPNAPVQEFLLDKAKKSAPNVSVKTDVKTGESLAGQIGPMMRDSTAIAEGAVKQVDAAQRIVKAVDEGKIFAGPLSSKRLLVSQVGQILGVGGADDAEKIANTRTAVRGLAELTLQGRQQMKGQGAITESEGRLAEKAMSGDIDSLTVPEIRQLAKASERAARFNYGEHQRKLQVMKDNPDLNKVAPFYQGPAMNPEVPGPTGKIGGVLTQNPDGTYNYGSSQ
jgi:hypothetical protein